MAETRRGVTSPVEAQPTSPMPIPMPMHTDPAISPPREGPPRDRTDGPPGYGPPPYGSYHYSYPPPYAPHGGGYYNYPPPSHYGGYAPPPSYSYGYGGYPSQHPNKPPSTEPKRRKSPSRRQEKDKKTSISAQVAEDIEMERMRAAAEPVQVKPMRSDYHFFVDEMRDKIQAVAEKELGPDANNKFLLLSNMNSRLMKAWEDASEETRADYMVKEEEDRRRFMSEDEIASRHCATLTARARSPRGKEGEEDEGTEGDGESKRKSPSKSVESPPKKAKTEDDDSPI